MRWEVSAHGRKRQFGVLRDVRLWDWSEGEGNLGRLGQAQESGSLFKIFAVFEIE